MTPTYAHRTELRTITTEKNKHIEVAKPVTWQRVRLTLDEKTTANVVVGMHSDLLPVSSGKGITLRSDQALEFVVGDGDTPTLASDTAGAIVNVIIEPIPWLPEIAELLARRPSG